MMAPRRQTELVDRLEHGGDVVERMVGPSRLGIAGDKVLAQCPAALSIYIARSHEPIPLGVEIFIHSCPQADITSPR